MVCLLIPPYRLYFVVRSETENSKLQPPSHLFFREASGGWNEIVLSDTLCEMRHANPWDLYAKPQWSHELEHRANFDPVQVALTRHHK